MIIIREPLGTPIPICPQLLKKPRALSSQSLRVAVALLCGGGWGSQSIYQALGLKDLLGRLFAVHLFVYHL